MAGGREFVEAVVRLPGRYHRWRLADLAAQPPAPDWTEISAFFKFGPAMIQAGKPGCASRTPEKRDEAGQVTLEELRSAIDRLLTEFDRPHVERLTIAAAIISEALRTNQLEATLVGGGAIEFYGPGAHTTTDIDLVVEGKGAIDLHRVVGRVMEGLGFSRKGRHWVKGDLFVEIPSTFMTDPTETFAIGPYTLSVIRKEIVLGERVVGFKHWRYTAYGAQAIDMIAAFRDDLDEDVLRAYLRREDAEDAYEALARLAAAGQPITSEVLDMELNRLRARSQEATNDGA